MLDFRVKTFLTACQLLNFTETARQLNLTQPAVSTQIRYLEREYGVKLFARDGRNLVLTPQGKLLEQAMRHLANDERRIKNQLKNDDLRTLTFGVTKTIGETALIKILAVYVKRHPGVNIKVTCANTASLLRQLQNGSLDFALVEGNFPRDLYAELPLAKEQFIGVAAKQHVFKTPPKRLEDLFSERLLVREPGSGTRNILERGLEQENFALINFSHFIQLENMHTIIELVKADCGISFLYKAAVAKDLEQGTLRELDLADFSASHGFSFIWSKKSLFGGEFAQTCQELRDCWLEK